MVAGSVSVDESGNVTKSGFAEIVYDDLVASTTALPGTASAEFVVAQKESLAAQANRLALVISYVQDNAKAEVSLTSVGLQSTPIPNAPAGGVATGPPLAPALLNIV